MASQHQDSWRPSYGEKNLCDNDMQSVKDEKRLITELSTFNTLPSKITGPPRDPLNDDGLSSSQTLGTLTTVEDHNSQHGDHEPRGLKRTFTATRSDNDETQKRQLRSSTSYLPTPLETPKTTEYTQTPSSWILPHCLYTKTQRLGGVGHGMAPSACRIWKPTSPAAFAAGSSQKQMTTLTVKDPETDPQDHHIVIADIHSSVREEGVSGLSFTPPRNSISTDRKMGLGLTPNDSFSGPLDEFPIDKALEEEMSQLLQNVSKDFDETHIPPSSLTRGWDHDSRSAEEYDSSLQYSSPESLPRDNATTVKPSEVPSSYLEPCSPAVNESFDDEEIDWDALLLTANNVIVNDLEAPSSHTECMSSADALKIHGSIEIEQNRPVVEKLITTLSPRSAHMKSPMSDFVNESLYTAPEVISTQSTSYFSQGAHTWHTCFRIGEMISLSVKCHNRGQVIVFELFARVTYSSRERNTRKQYFQFVDLEKDQQPYPGGYLRDWKPGSDLDVRAMSFLDKTPGFKVCRCVCKPKRDTRAAIGWSYEIIDIETADKRQVEVEKQAWQRAGH